MVQEATASGHVVRPPAADEKPIRQLMLLTRLPLSKKASACVKTTGLPSLSSS